MTFRMIGLSAAFALTAGVIRPRVYLSARLLDARLLRSKLCVHRSGKLAQAFLFDLQAQSQLLGSEHGALILNSRHDTVLGQLPFGFGLKAGTFVFRTRNADRSALIQALTLELQLRIGQIRFGCFERKSRLFHLLHEIGVGHFDEQRVRFDRLTRANENAFDAAAGLGGNPANLARHQFARSAHLPNHLAFAHRIDPHRRPRYRRHGRFEPGNEDNGGDDCQCCSAAPDDLSAALLLPEFRTCNIHRGAVKPRLQNR